MIDLDELERIGKAATPGPWAALPSFGECLGSNEIWHDSQYLGVMNTPWHSNAQQQADRDLCVAARNNWQAMIDELRRLNTYFDYMEEGVGSLYWNIETILEHFNEDGTLKGDGKWRGVAIYKAIQELNAAHSKIGDRLNAIDWTTRQPKSDVASERQP